MQNLMQDLRYGLRKLLKNPGYTLIVVFTLAVCIGANMAIFSVVNAVMLRPLPYLDGERFVALGSFDRLKSGEQSAGLAPGNFWELKQSAQSFAPLVGMIGSGFSFPGEDYSENVPAVMVTASLFQAVNARPLLGRVITDNDACANCPPVVLLSHRLWQRRFGGDPNIVGRKLPESGAQVIGVMPQDFKFPAQAEIWQPLPDHLQSQDRGSRYFQVYGLLKPGTSVDQAQAEMRSFALRFEQDFPKENANLEFAVTPYRDHLSRDVHASLLVLLGTSLLVLLIACANVASLMLSRAVSQKKELAIRAALGASRVILIRQWLIESLLLSVLGAVAGWLMAIWAQDALLKLVPETYGYLQLQDQLRNDFRVLGFTLAVAMLTGLLFGLFPAWQASRSTLTADLKEGRQSSSRQTLRVRGALVVAEVALAFVLLTGAGLLVNSFLRLQQVELGFDPQNVLGAGLNVPMNKPQPERIQLIRQLQQAAAGVPEVESVAVTTGNVFPYLNFQLNRADKPLPAGESVLYDAISPNYFTALRGSLRVGRYFTEQDTTTTEPVALINETLARRFFANEDPVDKYVTLNYLGRPQKRRIVGVARDLNQGDLNKLQPQIYVPYAQQPWFSAALIIRAKTSPAAARRSIQSALKLIDDKQNVTKNDSAEELLSSKLSEPRLYTGLISMFGALSLILSAVGLFGQVSYSVAQRMCELGIRIALGAQPRDILRQIIGQGMRMTAVGLLIGFAAALGLTKALGNLLYGVSATDPLTFAVIAILLSVVALAACWLPARRATRVDPMIAMRQE